MKCTVNLNIRIKHFTYMMGASEFVLMNKINGEEKSKD